MPFKMPRFFCCVDSEVSRVRLTVQSRCFNRRKVVFRIHTKNAKDLNESDRQSAGTQSQRL